jgi:hypothetical protein
LLSVCYRLFEFYSTEFPAICGQIRAIYWQLTETGQSEALALKRSNFPEKLYPYRSLERLAYTLEELRDRYVFLSKPAAFNDPYDSALSASLEHVRRQTLEQFGREYFNDPESKFVGSLLMTAKRPYIHALANRLWERIRKVLAKGLASRSRPSASDQTLLRGFDPSRNWHITDAPRRAHRTSRSRLCCSAGSRGDGRRS